MIDVPIMTTSLSGEEITPAVVQPYIKQFNDNALPRLVRLDKYYNGQHEILNRSKNSNLSNNKIVVNHASYIATLTSAYLLGDPIKYTAPDNVDISGLLEALRKADAATQDSDLALDAAIYGTCYELIYFSTDKVPEIRLARLSPLSTFVVYDDTVEQNPVFGAYYYPVRDQSGSIIKYKGCYYTDSESCEFELDTAFSLKSSEPPQPHYFGGVPIVEFYNDGRRSGDFEQVTSLIDAYNLLQSDRVNDKEQFVDAILLITGANLGATDDEEAETLKSIKEDRVMMLRDDGSSAQYLTRQFDEGSVEVLQRRLEQSIHKISMTPDMSDENFASNTSGVAMKYKLLPLEQRTKIKERYFAEGLRERLELIQNALSAQGSAALDLSQIEITFSRSLPVNELEIAQTAQTLSGIVPQETVLGMIPAITDVQDALDKLEAERQETLKAQQEAFGNKPLPEDDKTE